MDKLCSTEDIDGVPGARSPILGKVLQYSIWKVPES